MEQKEYGLDVIDSTRNEQNGEIKTHIESSVHTKRVLSGPKKLWSGRSSEEEGPKGTSTVTSRSESLRLLLIQSPYGGQDRRRWNKIPGPSASFPDGGVRSRGRGGRSKVLGRCDDV